MTAVRPTASGGAAGGDLSGTYPNPTRAVRQPRADVFGRYQPRPSDIITVDPQTDGWSGTGATNDTTEFQLAAQSHRLGPTDGASGTFFTRKLALAAKDWTGLLPVLVVKASDMSKVLELQLRMGDTSLANYYQWKLNEPSAGAYPWKQNGEWNIIPLSWGGVTTVGTPNRASITDYFVRLSDTGSGNIATAWFNGLWAQPKHPSFPNGVISFTFDDGVSSTYTQARPVMDKYGWAGTNYVIVSRIGLANYLTLTQMQQLSKSGWAHGIHAYDYTTVHEPGYDQVTDAVLEADLVASRKWLSDNGFGEGSDVGAYPLGHFSPSVISAVKRHAAAFRSLKGGYSLSLHWDTETLPPADPYRLRIVYVQQTTLVSELQSVITQAVADGCWVHLVWHRLVTVAPANNLEWPAANFATLVDWIATTFPTTPVMTAGQVVRELRQSHRLPLEPAATTPGLRSLGTGTVQAAQGSTVALKANNLSDLASASAARANLGVGSVWRASDHGLIAWSYDPGLAPNQFQITAGTVYGVVLKLDALVPITNVELDLVTAGATLTASQCFAGLYQFNGANWVQLGVTASQDANWVAAGNKTMALASGPFTPGFATIAVCFVANGTTMPQFSRITGVSARHNYKLATANSRYFTANTAQTTLPGTLGALSALTVNTWAGVS